MPEQRDPQVLPGLTASKVPWGQRVRRALQGPLAQVAQMEQQGLMVYKE